MIKPKHCTNPKCHRPYIDKGEDIYVEVLLYITYPSGISENRIISVCKYCKKNFNMKMAEVVMDEIVPVEVNRIQKDVKIPQNEKDMMISEFADYKIIAWGNNIDDLMKKV